MKILDFTDGSFLLKTLIKDGNSFAAGKIGINELLTIYMYINNRKCKFDVERFDICQNIEIFNQRLLDLESVDEKNYWNSTTYEKAFLGMGLFPKQKESIFDFLRVIVKDIQELDISTVWAQDKLKKFEKDFILNLSPNCRLIEQRSLESYYSGTPWTEELKNKKVLIVSPFTESIKKQYEKRKLLWRDPRILPDFELLTLTHSLNPNLGVSSKFNSWIEMLQDTKARISNIDFDIALIGASASSLPIAAHCKRMGRQAVHLGGSLQVLFGITGERWQTKPIVKSFENENWTRVSFEETPPFFKQLENGCYW